MASKPRNRRPKRSIRSIFLTHADNDRHPHLLRYGAISVVLLLVLGVEFASVLQSSNLTSSPTQLGAVLPAVVTDLTNQQRAADNLSTLTPNALLTEAAQDVANDMVTQEYFAHVNPEGKTPWDWLDQVGYQYQYAGQNLAVNFDDSQQLMTAWMNSPEHKANILGDNFAQIGVALATGTYQGQQAVFVVQYFASPVQLASTQVSAPAAPLPASPVVAPQTPVPTAPTVAAAETQTSAPVPQTSPSFWTLIMSSPRTYATDALLAIAAFFALLLILGLIPRSRHLLHPRATINGVALVAVIIGILILNQSLLFKGVSLPPNNAQSAAVDLTTHT
jgi:uncharacterized protein YkwD